MSKHTPGPWITDGEFVMDADERFLAEVCEGGDYEDGDGKPMPVTEAEADKNSALMSASPDLLDALKQILASAVPNQVEHPSMSAAWKVARSAIAKAEGR